MMKNKLIFYFFSSGLFCGLALVNGLSPLACAGIFIFTFFILLTVSYLIGLRRIIYSAAVILAILSLLELSLHILDKDGALSMNKEKSWLHGQIPYSHTLVCYPWNIKGRFPLDLRDRSLREKYNIEDSDWQRTPFCVEERYNSRGYREREVSLKGSKPRVIFIGDSFALGEGVSVDERFSNILASGSWKGKSEVYNFGKTGFNIEEIYGQSFKDALNYSADIIVYCYTLNDPVVCGQALIQQKYINDLMNIRYYNSDIYKFFEEKLNDQSLPDWRRRCLKLERDILFNFKTFFVLRQIIFGRLIAQETVKWYRQMYSSENECWDKTKDMILKMNRDCRARNIKFSLVILPVFYSLKKYPFKDVHRDLSDFCLKNNIKYRDLLDCFLGHRDKDCIVHPLDYHPNAYAHRIMAQGLCDIIKDDR
jgi:hypothetical protein